MSTSRLTRAAAAASLLAGGLAATSAAPAAAATCTSGVAGDVNGDGYAEVAVSEAGRSYGKGAVHVFYGRAKGIAASASGRALDDQYLDQDVTGVPGVGTSYHDFGSDLAFGDYNADGCADLAVGASGGGGGTVTLFYGSTSGLKAVGSTQISYREDPGSPLERGFGGLLRACDLNDDGVTDLALGVPRQIGGPHEPGSLAILFGGSGGLGESRSTVLDREAAGISEEAGPIDELAIGDFDGNGVQEMALGLDNGTVQVLEAGADGFTPTMAQPVSGPDLGVDDLVAGEDDDEDTRVFGDIMVAGDVDADGFDDLAVGMPAVGSEGGEVVLVRGSATGLTSTGLQRWNQSTTGVVGTPGEDDAFGISLAMGRLDAGPTDDLGIGTPGDIIDTQRGAGSVVVLLGSPTGLTTAGDGGARFHQNISGVAGTSERDEWFGRTVSISNVQSRTQGSLVIGTPREKIGSVSATGQLLQLSTAAGGPKAAGSVTLHLDSSGVRGASRKEAEFSRHLG